MLDSNFLRMLLEGEGSLVVSESSVAGRYRPRMDVEALRFNERGYLIERLWVKTKRRRVAP